MKELKIISFVGLQSSLILSAVTKAPFSKGLFLILAVFYLFMYYKSSKK